MDIILQGKVLGLVNSFSRLAGELGLVTVYTVLEVFVLVFCSGINEGTEQLAEYDYVSRITCCKQRLDGLCRLSASPQESYPRPPCRA